MELQFSRATKTQSFLRLAIFGPSGSGKTLTSLRIASGISDRIALIDSERGSASKYADRFTFDVLNLPSLDINTYCAAVVAAQRAGYPVLIIDTISHAWYELLAEVDRIARAQFGGNTWSAWAQGTPKQRQFIDVLLSYPGHLIATMRTKTEWQVTTDDRGKLRPVRLGLAPEQGKGIEYEFDLLMELSPDHVGTITKDRTSRFQDRIIEQPGEELGRELAAWLGNGIAPAPPATPLVTPQAAESSRHMQNGNPPARKPSDLLQIVNVRLQMPYDNIHHLRNAIAQELGNGWAWPAYADSAGWIAAYEAAIRHAQAKAEAG